MDVLRSLEIVKVIRYRSKEWNQTNYYNLNYGKLREWAEAQSIEISELCNSSSQGDNNQTLEIRKTEFSLYESKTTTKERTTKQSDRFIDKSNSTAAATSKEVLEEERSQKSSNPHLTELNTPLGQNKSKSEANKQNVGEETNVLKVDYIVNKNWKKLIPELDSAGIPINKTVTSLLKLYPKEKVEGAIALLRARKREQHIPNVAGYFVAALKQDWGSKQVVESSGAEGDIDKATVFRHWYDLARELGYCSGQEVREGSQWINLSGSWEKWEEAVKRGYSLDYLKKIIKR